jgi:DNA-binding MarR family transcriptional regulator
MDHFAEQLNNLLVDTFRNILKVEQELVQRSGTNLSISELHMLEAVGKDRIKGRTISDLAGDMDISPPSVTIAGNKLQNKGYVTKDKCENDGRVVYVKLTKLGSKTNAAHQFFHQSLVRSLVKDLAPEEQQAMYKGKCEIR